MDIKNHRQYIIAKIGDVNECISTVNNILSRIKQNKNTLYTHSRVLEDCKKHLKSLHKLRRNRKHKYKIEGYKLYWIYKQCKFYTMKPPACTPYIYKTVINDTHKYFCMDRDEWQKTVNNNVKKDDTLDVISVTAHAKLQYISRVLGFDVDRMLNSFPHKQLLEKSSADKNEQHITIDGFVYILGYKRACTTILEPHMLARRLVND